MDCKNSNFNYICIQKGQKNDTSDIVLNKICIFMLIVQFSTSCNA